MVSESARYYQTHPAARERKKKYDTRFESSPTQKAKRRELARHNAEHDKKYGSASRRGMDASHTKSGIRYKPSSVIVVPRLIWLEIEELGAVADSDCRNIRKE